MKNNSKFSKFYILLPIFAGASYGLGGAISSLVNDKIGLTSSQLCLIQYSISFLILGLLTLIKFKQKVKTKYFFIFFLLGFLESFSTFAFFMALNKLSVHTGVALQFQYVWLVVLLQCIFEKTLPNKFTLISTILIIVGTFFGSGIAEDIFTNNLNLDPLGIMWAVICCLCYTLYLFLNNKIKYEINPIEKSFFISIGCTFIALIVFLISKDYQNFNILNGLGFGSLESLLMVLLPILCVVISSSKVSSGIVAVGNSFELPMSTIMGAILLKEKLTPTIIIGIIVIIIGIFIMDLLPEILSNRNQKNKDKK